MPAQAAALVGKLPFAERPGDGLVRAVQADAGVEQRGQLGVVGHPVDQRRVVELALDLDDDRHADDQEIDPPRPGLLTAEVDLAVLDNGPDGAAGSLRVEHLAARRRTRGGFRPADEPVELAAGEGDVLGLAGWSWRVANTPRARGRYLRGFLVTATGSGATMVVSNRGEVTRPTVLDLAVDVVVRGPDAG